MKQPSCAQAGSSACMPTFRPVPGQLRCANGSAWPHVRLFSQPCLLCCSARSLESLLLLCLLAWVPCCSACLLKCFCCSACLLKCFCCSACSLEPLATLLACLSAFCCSARSLEPLAALPASLSAFCCSDRSLEPLLLLYLLAEVPFAALLARLSSFLLLCWALKKAHCACALGSQSRYGTSSTSEHAASAGSLRYNPVDVKRASELLLAGAVMGRRFQPFEAHVPYLLQIKVGCCCLCSTYCPRMCARACEFTCVFTCVYMCVYVCVRTREQAHLLCPLCVQIKVECCCMLPVRDLCVCSLRWNAGACSLCVTTVWFKRR